MSLLRIDHLGTTGEHRIYHAQTPAGLSAIIKLSVWGDTEIAILLAGTYYRREYPASGQPEPAQPPRIRDLEGGYQTVQTFLYTWEHATTEQRELLCESHPAKPSPYVTRKKGASKRTKRAIVHSEDRSIKVQATQAGEWYRVLAADLRAALRGTKNAQNIRLGHVTVKRSILYSLLDTKSALTRDAVVELCHDSEPFGGALRIRSADGRAQVRLNHGAGDPHKGRYGFARRIAFVPA